MEGKEELNPTEIVKVRWVAAKEKLARLIADVFDNERRQDLNFAKKFGNDPNLDGLIYSLGHGSGTLRDFPEVIEIITYKPLLENEEELQAITPFPDLLTQLAQNITTFLTNHKIREQRPNIYQNEINALNLLAHQTNNKKVSLTFFETERKGVYSLSSAEVT